MGYVLTRKRVYAGLGQKRTVWRMHHPDPSVPGYDMKTLRDMWTWWAHHAARVITKQNEVARVIDVYRASGVRKRHEIRLWLSNPGAHPPPHGMSGKKGVSLHWRNLPRFWKERVSQIPWTDQRSPDFYNHCCPELDALDHQLKRDKLARQLPKASCSTSPRTAKRL